MNLPIKPCGHYVLVKPDPIEKVTASGIITGTTDLHSREEVARVKGTLVAVGENAWKAFGQGEDDGIGKPWAEVGNHVYYKRHVSDRYLDENDYIDGKPQEYFLLSDDNILAVINDDQETLAAIDEIILVDVEE